MVDESPVEKKPDKLVWLSSNCCDLTPASQPPRAVQAVVPKTIDRVPPVSRLRRLLRRMPRVTRPR
jgi:hypothetical protein